MMLYFVYRSCLCMTLLVVYVLFLPLAFTFYNFPKQKKTFHRLRKLIQIGYSDTPHIFHRRKKNETTYIEGLNIWFHCLLFAFSRSIMFFFPLT